MRRMSGHSVHDVISSDDDAQQPSKKRKRNASGTSLDERLKGKKVKECRVDIPEMSEEVKKALEQYGSVSCIICWL